MPAVVAWGARQLDAATDLVGLALVRRARVIQLDGIVKRSNGPPRFQRQLT
jgi:hypothetical protein